MVHPNIHKVSRGDSITNAHFFCLLILASPYYWLVLKDPVSIFNGMYQNQPQIATNDISSNSRLLVANTKCCTSLYSVAV